VPDGSGKSGGLSPSLILFVLALFGVGAPLMVSATHSTPPAAIASDKPPTSVGHENSAADLIEEFYDANPDQLVDTDRPWQRDELIYPRPDDAWGSSDPRRNDRISFLIATVPNPENPSLRYEFDRYIDSIQRALSHENYLLDKTYLPWIDELSAQSGGAASSKSREQWRHPGVMLFRRLDTSNLGSNDADRHPARERLTVVFVVGETPTDGVDAASLRSALDQIAWLRGWTVGAPRNADGWIIESAGVEAFDLTPDQVEWLEASLDGYTPAPPHLVSLTENPPDEIADGFRNEIKIVGPSYSGSSKSIQEVLRSWLEHRGFTQSAPHVRILSGTTSAIGNWPQKLAEFHSTQWPEIETSSRIFRFFKHHLNDPRIAILTDDTGYGTNYGASVRNAAEATVLPYPIHISDVRTAYESIRTQRQAPGTPPMDLAHRDPSISDEDPGSDRYLLPSFSRASAADDEVVLANLLATIQRERFHYVGIVATNIQDAIFLIREIRDNCPDTIPFLTSADLLYLHSDYNRDLAGTLIFSTYPLFASNQIWTGAFDEDHRLYQFPSGETEGLYNAMLWALSDPDGMVEYAEPFSRESKGPPLWVSVVGNDDLWPVSIYALPPADNYIEQRAHPPLARSLRNNLGTYIFPRPFDVTYALIILLCTLPHLYMIKRRVQAGTHTCRICRGLAKITPEPPRWFDRLIEMPADIDAGNRADRRLSVLSFFLVLLTFLIVATSIWMLPLRAMSLWNPAGFSSWTLFLRDTLKDNWRLLIWTLGPTLFALLVIIPGLAGLVRDISGQALPKTEPGSTKIAFGDLLSQGSRMASIRFVASVIGPLLAICFAISIWSQDPLEALFYFVRSADLWNGVSPLLPMLYIGLAALWLSVTELSRLSLSDQYVLTNDFLGFDDQGSFAGIGVQVSDTVRLLKCSNDDIPFCWLWILLPFAVYVVLDMPGVKLVALDGRIFNLFIIAIAIFVFGSLLLLFGRFIAVWFRLRSLLYRLYMHPTRHAYEELRTGSAAPSMADRNRIWLLEPAESVTAVEFCLERVREMLRKVEPSKAIKNSPALIFQPGTLAHRVDAERMALTKLVGDAQAPLTDFLSSEATGRWQTAIESKNSLQRAMSMLSRQVARIFEPWWHLESGSPLTSNAAGGQPELDESLAKIAELFVASRLVDFLRQVFPQMINLVVFASVGLLAMMLALSSYPFPQRDTVGLLSWIILLSVIGATFFVFIQINRDRVVSMLLGTTPGELNWNSGFIWQIVIFGVVPILTLAGAQFPHALQGVISSVGGIFGSPH
jgi:hypothetical protein